MLLTTLITFVCLLTSCQYNRKFKCNFDRRTITINTEPAGATVIQNHSLGQPATRLGTTPLIEQPVVVLTEITKMENISFTQTQEFLKFAGGNLAVKIKKDGYETYQGYLSTESDNTSIHNITLKPKTEPK